MEFPLACRQSISKSFRQDVDCIERRVPAEGHHSYRHRLGAVLHPQFQHVGDYTEAFRLMCPNIEIIRLEEPEDIFPAYQKALTREDGKSTILVEYGDYYSEK